MISFEDYFDLLEERKKILNYFNDEIKSIAENSKYHRNTKVTKKQQKDSEKSRLSGLNIYYHIYNKKLKEKGLKVSAVKETEIKDNLFKRIFKKIFGIKPQEVPGTIEPLMVEISEDTNKNSEIESEATLVVNNIDHLEEDDDIEDVGDPEYTEEELNQLYPNDTINGQMDIEELNEGDVYDKN